MIDNPRSEAMTLDTFQYLADAYGANLERWPKAMLPAATRLFASSAPARAVLAEAQALDRLLDTPPPVVTSNATDLAERIVESLRGTIRWKISPMLISEKHWFWTPETARPVCEIDCGPNSCEIEFSLKFSRLKNKSH